MPCALVKLSCNCLRSAITADMSASLNVVRIAAVCCALTSCVAILRRSGEIFLRVVRPPAAAVGAGADAAGSAGSVEAGGPAVDGGGVAVGGATAAEAAGAEAVGAGAV